MKFWKQVEYGFRRSLLNFGSDPKCLLDILSCSQTVHWSTGAKSERAVGGNQLRRSADVAYQSSARRYGNDTVPTSLSRRVGVPSAECRLSYGSQRVTQPSEAEKDQLHFLNSYWFFRLEWELTSEMENTIHQCLENYQNVVSRWSGSPIVLDNSAAGLVCRMTQ